MAGLTSYLGVGISLLGKCIIDTKVVDIRSSILVNAESSENMTFFHTFIGLLNFDFNIGIYRLGLGIACKNRKFIFSSKVYFKSNSSRVSECCSECQSCLACQFGLSVVLRLPFYTATAFFLVCC